jgi:diguanylate cyclase (GGDEF)-like protein
MTRTPMLGEAAVPRRALALSACALAVPVAGTLYAPDIAGGRDVLLWLPAIVPAFLLAYHRGWRGAAVALAAGMAALSVTQLLFVLFDAGGGVSVGLLLNMVALYIAVTLGSGWLSELLIQARRSAERLALTDPVTLLSNRRHAELVLEKRFAAARRGQPLAVVLYDVDRFKAFNDAHGHGAGDEALRRVADVLRQATSPADLSARWGGDEFITILTPRAAPGVAAFVQRVVFAVRQVGPISAGARAEASTGWVTVSVGVAHFEPSMTSVAELIIAADAALYRAKEEGSDCVRISTPAVGGGRGASPPLACA